MSGRTLYFISGAGKVGQGTSLGSLMVLLEENKERGKKEKP